MINYMTKYGIEVIKMRIFEIDMKRKEALKKAGESASGDSNSYHDNFDYEQGMRDQELYSKMLHNLYNLLSDAVEVPKPTNNNKISIGHLVKIEEVDSGKESEYLFCGNGEGIVFQNAVSAESPLGLALIGMNLEEEKEIQLPGRKITVYIKEIKVASLKDFDIARNTIKVMK